MSMLSRLQVGTSPGSCSDGTTEYGSTGSALVSPDSTGKKRPTPPPRQPLAPEAAGPVPRRSTSKPASSPVSSDGAGPSGAGAEALGASLFSVPPREAPSTGIYALPEAAFKIRDLDSGAEYALDKRFWIKDRDTGAVYVLESGAERGGEAGQGPNGASPGSPSPLDATAGQVRDLFSGRALTLDEFEGAMGYSGLGRRSGQAAAPATDSAAPGPAPGAAAAGGAAARPRSLASWLRAGVDSVLHRSGSNPPPEREGDGLPGSAVRSAAHGKRAGAAGQVRLMQHLEAHAGVIWSMQFSRNGRYLATAGQDFVVRVWQVLSAAQPAADGEARGTGSPAVSRLGAGAAQAPALLLSPTPHRVYTGHKQDVLDLTWSKTQFLLSASMDKTVRLWHVSMDECLRVFKHSDFVTAIDFHPSDDRTFISGSIDGKLRLWSIPDQKVVSWQDVHEMVTAASYSPSGLQVVVGTMKGKCRFYAIQDSSLEYEAQLDVKNTRGQHARGKKITGLTFLPRSPSHLLITSNDSRIRLYEGYNLRAKFKGHANRSTQIKASLSPSCDTIICGSDDGWVYQWAVPSRPGARPEDAVVKEKVLSYECFLAASDVVTVAMFAPERALATWPTQPGKGGAGVATPRVILAAGYGGEIKVFEDLHQP
uniref:Uncharacterized protein n=1 Tax=Auxenochlorella protothecoides TaxID=3075 RepID=A0A1D1ZS76_AUXPR